MSSNRIPPRMRSLVMLGLAVIVAGCGDPGLWVRYRAEQSFWRARRLADRIELNPQRAAPADYARAIAAFRAIAARFPAGEWASADRGMRRRETGAVSGRALIAAARLEAMRGRTGEALASYAAAARDYRAIPVVALEAEASRADLLGRLGREGEALEAWSGIARDYPLVDPDRPAALQPVLDAPFRAALLLERAGRPAARDSLLAAAERRLLEALGPARGGAAAPALWLALAGVRDERGKLLEALDALRRTLSEPADRENAPNRILALAHAALERGRPDTALAYARWAAAAFGGPVGAEGMLLIGRAWEAQGGLDSALAAYGDLLEAYPKAQDSSAEARFRRGAIYESRGTWELARSEYRALVAAQPTQPLAFEAILRIVKYYRGRGEDESARMESRQALESMDNLIATQRDETVQQWARRTRAELTVASGDAGAAVDALSDLWRRYPGTPLGTDAGLKAAGIAERTLHDPSRALELYRQIAAAAADSVARERARAAVERLGRARG